MIRATLSVNAGISLETEQTRIWIDAIHDRKTEPFSALTPDLQREVFTNKDFSDPDAVIFTHLHPDHFSLPLLRTAARRYPDAVCVLPEEIEDTALAGRNVEILRKEIHQIRIHDVKITFRKLEHEGNEYQRISHYGILMEQNGRRYLFAGDCAVGNPLLKEWIGDLPLEAAFLPFPWMTLSRGRQFLRDGNFANQIVLYHLPVPWEDSQHYIEITQKCCRKYFPEKEIRILNRPFEGIVLTA